MAEALALRVPVHKRAAGIALEAFGDAAAYKGIIKYVVLFAVFSLLRGIGHPVSDDAPVFTALEEKVPYHIGYPFAFFARHLNHLTFPQAVTEGLAVWVVGRLAVGVGRELKNNRL